MLPTRLNAEIVGEYLSRGLWDKTSLSVYWDRNGSLDPRSAATEVRLVKENGEPAGADEIGELRGAARAVLPATFKI